MDFNSITTIILCAVSVLLIIFIILTIINTVKLRKINRNSKNGNIGETIEKYYNKIAKFEEINCFIRIIRGC